jgi:hypothetical protein
MTYLIWSNEHDGWWGPGERGYTRTLDKAGLYSREDAIRICKHALPTSMHIGRIAEVPVRLADLEDIIADELIRFEWMGKPRDA